MGGVATYILIGMVWAFGYKLLMQTHPDAIHFESSFTGVPTGEPSRLMYFSFSTLTSVSYGDVRPVHRVARSLATAEALVGQLYPSVLIATLVGMSLQTRSSSGNVISQNNPTLFDDNKKNGVESFARASLKSKYFGE